MFPSRPLLTSVVVDLVHMLIFVLPICAPYVFLLPVDCLSGIASCWITTFHNLYALQGQVRLRRWRCTLSPGNSAYLFLFKVGCRQSHVLLHFQFLRFLCNTWYSLSGSPNLITGWQISWIQICRNCGAELTTRYQRFVRDSLNFVAEWISFTDHWFESVFLQMAC